MGNQLTQWPERQLFDGKLFGLVIIIYASHGMPYFTMQVCGRNQISLQVSGFSVQVSGFGVWGLLTPET